MGGWLMGTCLIMIFLLVGQVSQAILVSTQTFKTLNKYFLNTLNLTDKKIALLRNRTQLSSISMCNKESDREWFA